MSIDCTSLDYLATSVKRQRKIYEGSIPLTPVDSIPLAFNEVDTSFLHGFYISDKVKTYVEQKNSIIQFSGRKRATADINKIHSTLASQLGASDGSLRLLSGLHAHMVVFMSLASIGDTVILLPDLAGGHFATKKILDRLGLETLLLPVDETLLCIDHEKASELIENSDPKFIFIDRSEGLRFEDFSFLKSFEKPIKIFDASQYLPQIMCKAYTNPFEWGFDLILFTVHKSFPGPQKAGIVTRVKDEVWTKLLEGLSSFVSSSHAENTFKLGFALQKFDIINYLGNMLVSLAEKLEAELTQKSVPVISRTLQGHAEWPATQHIWIRCENKDKAFELYSNLAKCRIHTNYRLLPYNLGWGIRLGTTSAIMLGLSECTLESMSELISKIYHKGFSLSIRHEVRKLREQMKEKSTIVWP